MKIFDFIATVLGTIAGAIVALIAIGIQLILTVVFFIIAWWFVTEVLL